VTSEMTLNVSAFRMNGMSRWILKNSMAVPGVDAARARYLVTGTLGVAVGRHTCPIDTLSRCLRLP
jgi:hypothetical protein